MNIPTIKFLALISLLIRSTSNLLRRKALLTAIVLIPLLALPSYGEEHKTTEELSKKEIRMANRAEARFLVARLHEIRDITKSQKLNPTQKLDLRREVLDIKKQLQEKDGVHLYLSMTAIIIILLLIILL